MYRAFLLGILLLAAYSHAATVAEDLRAAVAAAPGVMVAIIQTDDAGAMLTEPMVPVTALVDGQRVKAPMKGTEGYVLARITYIVKEGNVVQDNTVAIAIAPDGTAAWHVRAPSVLAVREQAPEPIGTEAELQAAIVAAGHAKVEKFRAEYGADYADVSGYSEAAGKLVEVRYHIAKDNKGAWVVKPYETQLTTEVIAR